MGSQYCPGNPASTNHLIRHPGGGSVLSGESKASSAIELQRRAQAHVHGERRLNIRHPGGGRGPDRKDARLARFAWIPASAGMTILHQKRERIFPGQQWAYAGMTKRVLR